MSTSTTHRLVGATIRAKNRTHGLAPARTEGEPETVVEVDTFDLMVTTDRGNTYLGGDYTIVRYAA